MCYAFVVTATMYGEEVANKKASCLGAVQEFMDYIHRFKRPRLVAESGSFDVPLKGFPCNFVNSFGYVKKHGLSPEALYPWVGHPSSSRYEPPNGDWDGIVKVGEYEVKDHEKIRIKNFVRLKTHDDVERMLHKQPVASSVLFTPEFIRCCSGDILKPVPVSVSDAPVHDVTEPLAEVDVARHAITLVGYGQEGEDKYYICQNTYGRSWGYKGYCKISRDLLGRMFVPEETESPSSTSRKKRKD